jgi:hypothetical protein
MLTHHNAGYTFMSAILTDRLHSAIARLSVNSRHRILGLMLADGCVRSVFDLHFGFGNDETHCADLAILFSE